MVNGENQWCNWLLPAIGDFELVNCAIFNYFITSVTTIFFLLLQCKEP